MGVTEPSGSTVRGTGPSRSLDRSLIRGRYVVSSIQICAAAWTFEHHTSSACCALLLARVALLLTLIGFAPHSAHLTHSLCAGYTFPYLFDESQAVAKAYKAACTPEFYVFDANQQLTYHGQFDDARPNSNKLVTGGVRTGDLCAQCMVPRVVRLIHGSHTGSYSADEPSWRGTQPV